MSTAGRWFPTPWLGETGHIEIRADAYNALNHANLGQPNGDLDSPSFGVALYGVGQPRTGLLPVPDLDNPVASSTAEGSMVIRNAELTTSYLSQPLRIISAQGILSPAQIAWTNASISYGRLEAQGTLEYPTVCAGSAPCAARCGWTTVA